MRFSTNGSEKLRIFSNGNIGINQTTDAGFRLDVNGTARIQNQLTTTGSITAASAIARGVYMNQTLVASANGDTLVGLDINPTFTVGAFTTNNYGLRVTGNIVPSADNLYSLGTSPLRFASVVGFQSIFTYYYAPSGQASYFGSSANTSINFPINNTVYARFHATTGNLTLQNGGTFTDAGYRLDVTGTTRLNGLQTFQGTTASDTALISRYGNFSWSQTDNLTTSVTRPTTLATNYLAEFRLPEYRASAITVALHALTTAQQNLLLALELRDVVRVCFQPSATGSVVAKYYQILGINCNADPERVEYTYKLASLDRLGMRLDSPYLAILDTSILG
jgi:hypothetical protein